MTCTCNSIYKRPVPRKTIMCFVILKLFNFKFKSNFFIIIYFVESEYLPSSSIDILFKICNVRQTILRNKIVPGVPEVCFFFIHSTFIPITHLKWIEIYNRVWPLIWKTFCKCNNENTNSRSIGFVHLKCVICPKGQKTCSRRKQ